VQDYEPNFTCFLYTCRPCNYYFTSFERHKGVPCKKCGKPMREKNLNPKPRKRRKKKEEQS
jgi:hypothetical protein